MFCFGFDWVVRLESLATLGIGSFIRLLLHRVTRSSKGCGSAASILEDNSRLLEDTFCKMFSPCWGLGFFFLAAFDTFDEWTRLRDTLASCLSFWDSFLLLGRNACPVVGQRTCLLELGQGKFDLEGECLASLFSNPAESMPADCPCWDEFITLDA